MLSLINITPWQVSPLINTVGVRSSLLKAPSHSFRSGLCHAALVTGCVVRLHSLRYWKCLLWTQLRSRTQKSGRRIFCVLGRAWRHEWLFILPLNRLIRVETALEQAVFASKTIANPIGRKEPFGGWLGVFSSSEGEYPQPSPAKRVRGGEQFSLWPSRPS